MKFNVINTDKISLNRKEYFSDILIISSLVLLSRFFFKSHFLFYIDSVNFALGLDQFSPLLHQPQPPGYYLYILSARFLKNFLSHANDIFVFISIIASLVSSIFIYLLSRAWFDRSSAIFSVLLFLISPLFWFHGEVAMIYLPETALILCFAYFSWLTFMSKTSNFWLIPSFIFALLIGFRPSDSLFIFPLWLTHFLLLSARQKIFSILIVFFLILMWSVPMFYEAGGVKTYFFALIDLWERVPGANPFNMHSFLIHSLLIFTGFIFSLGFGAPLIFINSLKISYPENLILFLMLWIMPGLIFFILIFFHPMTMGYALFIYAPLLIICGTKASRWYSESKASLRIKNMGVGFLIACNVSLFLYGPMYFSWRHMKSVEAYLDNMTKDVSQTFHSNDTLLIGFDTVFYGFRQVGYYLSDFKILEYPEIKTHDGIRTFSMYHQRTSLTNSFSQKEMKNVLVVCPLICETDFNNSNKLNYEVHIQSELEKKLPPNTLKLLKKEDREYLLFEAKYLPLLFPNAF